MQIEKNTLTLMEEKRWVRTCLESEEDEEIKRLFRDKIYERTETKNLKNRNWKSRTNWILWLSEGRQPHDLKRFKKIKSGVHHFSISSILKNYLIKKIALELHRVESKYLS